MAKVAWKVVREVKAPQEGVLAKAYVIKQRGSKCEQHKAGSVLTDPCYRGCKLTVTRGLTDTDRAAKAAKEAARDYALTLAAKSPKYNDDELVADYVKCLSDQYADRNNDKYKGEARLSKNGNYGDPVTVEVGLYLRPLNLYWAVWTSHAVTRVVSVSCKYCYRGIGSQFTHTNDGLVASAATHYYECAMIRQWQRKANREWERAMAAK